MFRPYSQVDRQLEADDLGRVGEGGHIDEDGAGARLPEDLLQQGMPLRRHPIH